MKKTVPFEIFGPNQYLMFDIQRLDEFEKKTGTSILALTQKDDYGFAFALDALPIAMKQHYFGLTREQWAEKIAGYIEDGNDGAGGDVTEITRPIVLAIWLSGMLGKKFQQIAESLVNKTPLEIDEVTEKPKNGKKAKLSKALPNG